MAWLVLYTYDVGTGWVQASDWLPEGIALRTAASFQAAGNPVGAWRWAPGAAMQWVTP